MKINFKKTLLSFLLFSILIFSSAIPIFAENIPIISETYDSDISLYSNNVRWIYKKINGTAYKRKYNYSTGEWIGNWIKC